MGHRSSKLLDYKFVADVLQARAPDGKHADGENLYCLVRGSSASWVFIKVLSGRQRQVNLGSVRKLADAAGTEILNLRARASLSKAREKALELRATLQNGGSIREPNSKKLSHTFDEMVSYYYRHKAMGGGREPNCVTLFRGILEEHQSRLSRAVVLDFRDHLIAKGRAENTVANYLGVIRAIISTYLNDHGPVLENPFHSFRYRKIGDAVNERDSLPLDVILKVFCDLEGDLKLMWLTLICTGARLSEIYGLRSVDVRPDGFLRIEKNARRRLKNAASDRTIPMFFELQQRTTEYYWSDFGSPSNLSQHFQRRINRYIPKELIGSRKITTHSLRHSLTDYIRHSGVQQAVEDFYLGHSAKNTSSRVYGSKQGREKAMQANLFPVLQNYVAEIGLPITLTLPGGRGFAK